ncbi:hypothetical protein [Mesorhizobium captivum]|uniref:hypothetical protein n=1 Tax=Mesorhizobium captivum TaxID=3072319 RepID=UPI002A2447A1|nr:hypothetical protein [Mesorhizobium sp. VK3C]MDX8449618.1 hypothetical protein [Mesorhizobium sp. VK3C]
MAKAGTSSRPAERDPIRRLDDIAIEKRWQGERFKLARVLPSGCWSGATTASLGSFVADRVMRRLFSEVKCDLEF